MKKVIAILMMSMSVAAQAQELPAGSTFIGLTDEGWKGFLCLEDGCNALDGVTDPRLVTATDKGNRVAFRDAQGGLIEIKGGSRKQIASPTDMDAYTQIRFDDAGNLWAARLHDRKSVMSDLVVIGEAGKSVKHKQLGANLDPYARGELLAYSKISCISHCGRPIQEIWLKDMASGISSQITLLNAVSKLPVITPGGDVVFVSDHDGAYRIWKHETETGKNSALTHGEGFDVSPSVTANGELFFIRRIDGKGQLAMLGKNGEAIMLEAPAGVMDVRDLKAAP